MRFELTPSLRLRLSDLAIVSILAAFTLAIRFRTLQEVEGGGDAVKSWYFVRQWFSGVDFASLNWDHHMTRFGINFPALVVRALFGSNATTYFLAPIGACVVAVILTYKIARDWSGPYAGVLAGLGLAIFPPMERAGSQLLPGVFSAAYNAFAAYALLRYWKSEGSRGAWVVACGVAVFLGYLTHEPNVFLIPGFAYGVWLCRRSKRHVLLFLTTLALLLAVETLFYLVFTKYSSRVAITLLQHRPGYLTTVNPVAQTNFWMLFDRYDGSLETSWKFLIYGFLGAGTALIAYGPVRARGILLASFGFLFCVTFAIGKLNPMMAWLSFESRYFMAIAPVAMAALACVMVSAIGECFRGRRRQATPGPLFPALFATLSTSLLGAIYAYGLKGRLPAESGWDIVSRRSNSFVEAFERGLPFRGDGTPGMKALRLAFGVYLTDQSLARGGKLPMLDQAITRLDSGSYWFAKNPRAFGPPAAGAQRFDLNAGCHYQLSIRGRFLQVRPGPTLPRDCRISTFNAGI